MKRFVILLVSFFFLISGGQSIAQSYQPDWNSLDKRSVPEWWTDAKFGIFIHWGVYSVPAYAPTDEANVYAKYSEHYESRLLSGNQKFVEHHKKFFGENFAYADFAPQFKAEYFNAGDWAALFKKAGAQYVVLTSKHHDGFCLWPSRFAPRWNSKEIGAHRDLLGELTDSVRAVGLRMGYYYSLLEWAHPLYSKSTINRWVEELMIPQMKELVTTYKPEIIFSDGEWDYDSKTLQSEKFLAWLYNESPVKETVVVNDRWGKETRSLHGGYYTTEYDLVHNAVGIGEAADHPWEESRGIGGSYGYNRFETTKDYLSSRQLIHLLIDKVSNGGNLLLNIGPNADGLIPVVMQERLLDIGKWLKVNGEAIYGTSAWRESPALKDGVAFTRKGNDLYILCTKWPDRKLQIEGVVKGKNVKLLGTDKKIRANFSGGKLTLDVTNIFPNDLPCEYAWAFKVENAF
ncbi:alpha-L-fucosidase [Parabacteroides sp. Marseille-P3160]|uniref:alpha-L-fucosidase n=1 Tax=Parabacteroides sp. Marseille-P3160 TaxID=1917887 RepID=UPI0009BA4B4B|nr:alpha-L-fucosidase [Parabacteroides sp. Marseille-P3160]